MSNNQKNSIYFKKYNKYKNKYLKLKNQIAGALKPLIGFGCGGMWRGSSEDISSYILYALSIGYRCLDCAYYYNNESQINKAIIDSGIPREELFIIGKADTEKEFELHIEKLSVVYLDLGLIHYYNSIEELFILWKYLVKKKEQGIMKEIGVSNIILSDLIELNNYCDRLHINKPTFIQNKIYTYDEYRNKIYFDDDLIDYCNENSINIIAHSPLGGSDYSQIKDLIIPIDGFTIPQIILRYLINKNIMVIPSARSNERILENFEGYTHNNFIPTNYNLI